MCEDPKGELKDDEDEECQPTLLGDFSQSCEALRTRTLHLLDESN